MAAPAAPNLRPIEILSDEELTTIPNGQLNDVITIKLFLTNDSIFHFIERVDDLTSLKTLYLWSLCQRSEHIDGTLQLLASLRQLTTLTSLSLVDMGIDPVAAHTLADSLPHLTALSTLKLTYNSIGESGCTSIVQALEGCPSLSGLFLAGNLICDIGCTALCQSPVFTQLITLDLANNQIGSAGFRELARALPSVRVLGHLILYDNSPGFFETAGIFETDIFTHRSRGIEIEQ